MSDALHQLQKLEEKSVKALSDDCHLLAQQMKQIQKQVLMLSKKVDATGAVQSPELLTDIIESSVQQLIPSIVKQVVASIVPILGSIVTDVIRSSTSPTPQLVSPSPLPASFSASADDDFSRDDEDNRCNVRPGQ